MLRSESLDHTDESSYRLSFSNGRNTRGTRRFFGALRQQKVQLGPYFRRVVRREVPLDRAVQPVHELYLGLPVEQPLRQRIVRNPVHRPRGHFRMKFDPSVVLEIAEKLMA